MPKIKPFKALRFNQKLVSLKNVVAPPYDVISEKYQTELYNRDKFNIVRLILGNEVDRYSSSANYLNNWKKEEILIKDEKEGFYLLVQTFKSLDGKLVKRKGIIALCKIEEFENKIILPHEKTLSKPKEDRLKLLHSTRTNLDQIFGLYSDESLLAEKIYEKYLSQKPILEVNFENVLNQIWKIENENDINSLTELLKSKQVLIADGHHRYETSLDYRNSQRGINTNYNGEEIYNYVVMFFTNMNDEGLVIFPTHRVVHSLPDFNWQKLQNSISLYFEIIDFPSLQGLEANLKKNSKHTFGIIVGSENPYKLLKIKNLALLNSFNSLNLPKELFELDVTILHTVILDKLMGISVAAQEKKIYIRYIQKIEECEKEVTSNEAQIAFLMNSTKIDEVKNISQKGFTMPQKSTYFYPKLISGLLLHEH